MIARGSGDGMDIGFERRLARNRKAVSPQKSSATSQSRLSSFRLSNDRAVQGFTSDLSSCGITA